MKILFGKSVLLLVVLWAAAAAAQTPTLTGTVTVTDGDSLRMGPVRIRIYGIDAPEIKQTCERAGTEYACGEAAKAAMERLTAGQVVTCDIGDVGKYGRLIGACWAGGVDIGREMVRSGWALAYREYSERYVGEENEARAGRRACGRENSWRPGNGGGGNNR